MFICKLFVRVDVIGISGGGGLMPGQHCGEVVGDGSGAGGLLISAAAIAAAAAATVATTAPEDHPTHFMQHHRHHVEHVRDK